MCRILIVNFIYKLALCLIIYSQSNKSGLCTSLLFPRQKKQTKKKTPNMQTEEVLTGAHDVSRPGQPHSNF